MPIPRWIPPHGYREVAQAAQTTAAAVTESQTATEDLARMSADLQNLVGQFKI